MSGDDAVGTGARRAASVSSRLLRAWRVMSHERRLAAVAAVGLFAALFLPWYQETVIASRHGTRLQSASASITGWGAFSFVEAAVLVVAAGVLVLLFKRAEGRAFHLPAGDGWVITAAGVWACVLIVWRMFDKQGTSVHGPGAITSGIEWGIFVALAIAVFLTYAGARIRAAHQPEPPLPGQRGRSPGPASPLAPVAPPTGSIPPARTSSPRPVAFDERATVPLAADENDTLPMRPPPTETAPARPREAEDEWPTIPFEPTRGDRR